MKKIIQLACIGIILFAASCKDQSNEINPLLFLQQCQGESSLTVTATYTGSTTLTGTPVGTGKMYVYLYRSLGLTTRDPAPVYRGSTTDPIVSGGLSSITINGICDGDYYVLVFFDLNGGDNENKANQTDPYVLYTNTPYTTSASKVNISGDVTLSGITFTDANVLLAQSYFMSTTTYTVTVNATYTGTAALPESEASKRIYVYLYNTSTPGTSTTNPALPINSASTTAEITPGTEYTIPVNGVLAGSYYALVFYDSVKGTATDSENDPYTFFAGTPYGANAQQFIVVNADMTLPDISFGDTSVLQTDAAYLTTAESGTLSVSATYNGPIPPDDANRGTMNICVYLYSVLGTGTRNQYMPIYTGVSGSPVTTTGGTATIDVADIIPGSYYVLVFYDYRTGTNIDGRYDRYILYNGVGYTSTASTLTINSGANPLSVTFDGYWQLQSGSLFVTP